MTESTGKMRDWIIALTEHDFSWKRVQGLDILDEIEREIAERYVELPLDADGVPIHCGERMRLDNGHEGEVWLIGVFDIMMSDHTCFDWSKSRHVKPRTVEDVLREFRELVTGERGGEIDDGDIEGFADEIRELLEVNE